MTSLQDIGDGWWEGQLENGEVGLFPESYCEMIGQPDGHAQVRGGCHMTCITGDSMMEREDHYLQYLLEYHH